MARVTLILNDDEKAALLKLAREQRRDPRAQAALCIRRKLEELGHLPTAEEMRQAEEQLTPEELEVARKLGLRASDYLQGKCRG